MKYNPKTMFKITNDPKIKTSEILAKMKKKFTVWSYWNEEELDKNFPPPKKETTRYFLKEQEASGRLENDIAGNISKAENPCTLRERLLMELKHFKEAGHFLDNSAWTLCGDKIASGCVPSVRCDPRSRRVYVDRWRPYGADGSLRFRPAISLESFSLESLPDILEINGEKYKKI